MVYGSSYHANLDNGGSKYEFLGYQAPYFLRLSKASPNFVWLMCVKSHFIRLCLLILYNTSRTSYFEFSTNVYNRCLFLVVVLVKNIILLLESKIL